MTDATMANLARQLAVALISYARDRRDDDKKDIARMQHLLCMEYRNEQAAPQEDEPDGTKT